MFAVANYVATASFAVISAPSSLWFFHLHLPVQLL